MRFLQLHVQIHQAVLDDLVLAQRAAKLPARAHVLARGVERQPRRAQCLGRVGDAGAVQRPACPRQQFLRGSLADQVRLRIDQPHASGVAAVVQSFVVQLQAACTGLDQEQAQLPLRARRAVNAGGQQQAVGAAGARRQTLFTGKSPALPVLAGQRLRRNQLAAAIGLPGCKGHAALARGQGRQPLRAQRLLRRVRQQPGRQHAAGNEGLDQQGMAQRLGQQGHVGQAAAQAAIGLRQRQGQPAHLGQRVPALRRAAAGVVRCLGAHGGRAGVFCPALHAVHQHALFVGGDGHSPSTCLARMLC